MPELDVQDLHLSFGGLKALKGVSFSVERSQIYSLIGPNGAGKTTIFNCISGLYRPQKGRIPLLTSEKTCKILLCAEDKGIDFCHECADFPCERFQPYADKAHFPHNMKMYQLCMMKKLGFETWAREKAAKIWDTYRTEPFNFDNILY